uniref:Secreted protein n=1 Tax=Chrysotila carterae TaxID=13221 RepID=A0A7S4F3N4_CHRCT
MHWVLALPVFLVKLVACMNVLSLPPHCRKPKRASLQTERARHVCRFGHHILSAASFGGADFVNFAAPAPAEAPAHSRAGCLNPTCELRLLRLLSILFLDASSSSQLRVCLAS